jgi:hypothetical protein
MASIVMGVAGCAAQAAEVAAPSGLRILDFDPSSGSGNTDAVDIQENEETISAQFNHDGSSFSSGAYSANINIGTLNSNYNGFAAAVTLEFAGFLHSSSMAASDLADCTFAWDVSVGSNTSLTAGSTSITGTASTTQNSLNFSGGNNGVGEKAVLTFGGSKSGLIFPSVNDVWEIDVSCTATNAGGSATASVNIEYTFVL